MNDTFDMRPVRLGVIGVGSMGKNHVRIAKQLAEVDFVGAVDPKGDQYRALAGDDTLPNVEALIEAGAEAAVVAVPSEHHAAVAIELADAGVHALIEKPVASTPDEAIRIIDAFAGTGLTAAVGHVERFNAASQELKRRLDGGTIGHVFAITTERVGPYPLRIRDVGVIKDLATHDLDLIRWLGGNIVHMEGQVAHKLGRPHEDLVEAIGRLESGAVIRMSVNWLTPTKRRTITVLGEGGAFVADLLSADLTYYANAEVPMEWDHMQRLRGVSEGDMIRFAFPKREPLVVEIINFCQEIRRVPGAQIVTLEEGLDAIRLADSLTNAYPPVDGPDAP
jgi:predicted dehydrogenase